MPEDHTLMPQLSKYEIRFCISQNRPKSYLSPIMFVSKVIHHRVGVKWFLKDSRWGKTYLKQLELPTTWQTTGRSLKLPALVPRPTNIPATITLPATDRHQCPASVYTRGKYIPSKSKALWRKSGSCSIPKSRTCQKMCRPVLLYTGARSHVYVEALKRNQSNGDLTAQKYRCAEVGVISWPLLSVSGLPSS